MGTGTLTGLRAEQRVGATSRSAGRWWAAVAVVGLLARWGTIAGTRVWNDEIFTLDLIGRPWGEFVGFFTAGGDVHPPMHYLTLWLLPTDSIAVLRVVNATVWWLLLVVAVRMLANRAPSQTPLLVLSGAAAVTPMFVLLGAELRMYGMLLALVTLLVAVAARDGSGVLLGLLAAAVGLTHYVGLFIAVGVVGWVLVTQHRRGAVALATWAMPMAVYMPVLVQHLHADMPYTTFGHETRWFLQLAVPVLVIAAGTHAWTRNARAAAAGTAGVIIATVGSLLTTGQNILTVGITTLAVWMVALTIASATVRLWFPAAQVAVLTIVAAFTPNVVLQPWEVEPNRRSTVAAYLEHGPAEHVVHVDWPHANRHFVEQVDADVTTIPFDEYRRVQNLHLEPGTLLVSRRAIPEKLGLPGERLSPAVWRR